MEPIKLQNNEKFLSSKTCKKLFRYGKSFTLFDVGGHDALSPKMCLTTVLKRQEQQS